MEAFMICISGPARTGGLLLGAVAVAGCASGAPKPAATPGRTVAASPRPSASATPTPSPSASDGTRLAACADADCEVRVAAGNTIRVRPKFKVGPMFVTSIKHGEIVLSITLTSSGVSYECQGHASCEVIGPSAQGPGAAIMTGHTGGRVTLNRVAVSVISITRRHAILRLSPA
jgi:hypothetical protein